MTIGGVLTITEQVQMLAAQRKTGELIVSNGHCKGTLYFCEGQIVDAMCGTSHKRGFHGAACVLCMSDNPASEFLPTGPPDVQRTVNIPTMAVLLEASRRMDEGERPCTMASANEAHQHNDGHPSVERFLRVILDGREEYLPLTGSVARVGRDKECDVFVPHASVSRRHADLHRIGPIFILRDVGSRNGTYVNGRKIQQARVDRGDEIRFALVQAFLVGAEVKDPYRRTDQVLAPAPIRANPAETMRIDLPAANPKMREIRGRL